MQNNLLCEYIKYVQNQCAINIKAVNDGYDLIDKSNSMFPKKRSIISHNTICELEYINLNISTINHFLNSRGLSIIYIESLEDIFSMIQKEISFLERKYRKKVTYSNICLDGKRLRLNMYFAQAFIYLVELSFINGSNVNIEYILCDNYFEFSIIFDQKFSYEDNIFYDIFLAFLGRNNATIHNSEREGVPLNISVELFNVERVNLGVIKKTVLLAEDIESCYILLNLSLRPEGIQIIRVKDGRSLFEKYKEDRLIIDLIITDIQMPIMNGMEAVKLIRELDNSIPIMLLSAACMDEEIMTCGCDIYMEKPINIKKLVSIINEIFKI